MAETLELSPQEARLQLEDAGGAVLIDVREPEEFALAHVAGAMLIPMSSIPAELPRLEALSDEKQLFVLCHHGVRSLQVVGWLHAQGIENALSVAGGIDRWSREVDPRIPRY